MVWTRKGRMVMCEAGVSRQPRRPRAGGRVTRTPTRRELLVWSAWAGALAVGALVLGVLTKPGQIADAELASLLQETVPAGARRLLNRSEEQTSELQSLMRTSYAVFCSQKKTNY